MTKRNTLAENTLIRNTTLTEYLFSFLRILGECYLFRLEYTSKNLLVVARTYLTSEIRYLTLWIAQTDPIGERNQVTLSLQPPI